jgi:hypothetical protein
VILARQALLALLVRKEYKVMLDPLDLKAYRAFKAFKAFKATQALLDLLAHRA